MIERIKSFKNIGTYENSGNGKIELKPYTFIYAANTYGKTTFCDIFRSLKTRDLFYITNRRRIGIKDTDNCEVDLTINGDNVVFKNGEWIVPKAANISNDLAIFDVNFVNDNFTNFEIEHKNKENLTSFILGERSVELIDFLKRLEQELSNKTAARSDINNHLLSYLKDVNIDAVIKTKYLDDFKEHECLMLSNKEQIHKLEGQINEIDKIKSMSLICTPQIDFNTILSLISQVKELCGYTFNIDLTKLRKQLDEIKKETPLISEHWIKEGLKQTTSTYPFCGSSIRNNERIEVFSQYFSEVIMSYIDKVENLQKLISKDYMVSSFASQILNIQNQKNAISKFINCSALTLFDELIINLQNYLTEIETLVLSSKEELESNLSAKLQSFASTSFLFEKSDRLVELIGLTKTSIQSLISSIIELNTTFSSYQSNLTEESIADEIKKLKDNYNSENLILLRGMHNEEIEKLLQIDDHIAEIKGKIKNTRNQIDKQESDFLDKYFTSIQSIFRQLGSSDFSLERDANERGKKKVYGIKIYYKNTLIDENRYCLSESDRRALALSIFLAKLEVDQNKNSILILDDPITSFDQDRMRKFSILLQTLKEKCFSQVILLMHYENFFRTISQAPKEEERVLIKIKRIRDNHCLEEIYKDDDIFKDEYEKTLDHIIRFINADIDELSENDVRKLVENYIQMFYAYEFAKDPSLKGGTLHNKVVNLYNKGFISKERMEELRNHISFLNDSSHEFVKFPLEEKRSFVKSVYDCLHELSR